MCYLGPVHFRLPELMAKRELTAYRLSQLLEGKMSRATVYRAANGSKAKLSPEEVAYLCDTLGVSPNELFGYSRK
jgi:DNA-binding Xre family transcriptional regulator